MGETSRSGFERIHEHMWLFMMKKEGDVEKNQSNSTLWQHSKAAHEGKMVTSDWKVKIVSSHVSPLSRQVTEAVRISRESPQNLLNSKMEFSSNNIPELEIRYGTKVLGGGTKRKRDGATKSSPTPIITKLNENLPRKDQGDVGPILPEPLAINSTTHIAANVTVEANEHGLQGTSAVLPLADEEGAFPSRPFAPSEYQEEGHAPPGRKLEPDQPEATTDSIKPTPIPTITKLEENLPGKDQDDVGPILPEPLTINSTTHIATDVAVEANECGLQETSTVLPTAEEEGGFPSGPFAPAEYQEEGPTTPGCKLEPKSTNISDYNSTEDTHDDEVSTPMPDRKKRRILSRVPSRNIHAMSKIELQNECKYWGLPVGGRKDEMISRLEKNTKNQSVLPFKLKLGMSTPSKRRRRSSDEEEVQPSPAKMFRNEGSRKDLEANEGRNRLESPASAPPKQPAHALEEDISTNIRSIQGGAIAGSSSFPQKGPSSANSNLNEQQNKISKQQNNSSNFHFKISRLSNHFSQNRPGTSGKTPNITNFQNSSPGENNRNRMLAPHNGQGETHTELNSTSETSKNSL